MLSRLASRRALAAAARARVLLAGGSQRGAAADAAPQFPQPPPLDTHALVRRLEKSGLSVVQAEALTAHLVELMAATLERLEGKFQTKTEAERGLLAHESSLSLFRAEIKMTLEGVGASVKRDSDGVKAELDKLRTGAWRSRPRRVGGTLTRRRRRAQS